VTLCYKYQKQGLFKD